MQLQSPSPLDFDLLEEKISITGFKEGPHRWLQLLSSHVNKNLSLFSISVCVCLRFIYLRGREREHKQEGQRKRERESQADLTLSTEPDPRLDPRTLRSRPEPK